MLDFQLLSQDDIVRPTDWCRPLIFDQNHDADSFSYLSGKPINNLKWISVSDCIGKCWWNRPAGEINENMQVVGYLFEFGCGTLPKEHVWDWRKEK